MEDPIDREDPIWELSHHLPRSTSDPVLPQDPGGSLVPPEEVKSEIKTGMKIGPNFIKNS